MAEALPLWVATPSKRLSDVQHLEVLDFVDVHMPNRTLFDVPNRIFVILEIFGHSLFSALTIKVYDSTQVNLLCTCASVRT